MNKIFFVSPKSIRTSNIFENIIPFEETLGYFMRFEYQKPFSKIDIQDIRNWFSPYIEEGYELLATEQEIFDFIKRETGKVFTSMDEIKSQIPDAFRDLISKPIESKTLYVHYNDIEEFTLADVTRGSLFSKNLPLSTVLDLCAIHSEKIVREEACLLLFNFVHHKGAIDTMWHFGNKKIKNEKYYIVLAEILGSLGDPNNLDRLNDIARHHPYAKHSVENAINLINSANEK